MIEEKTIIPLVDRFLDTAARVEMPGPNGIITYLDTVETEHSVEPGEIPEISIQPVTKFVQSETYQVSAEVSQEMEKDLAAFNIDPVAELSSTVYNETLRNTQKDLLKLYGELGAQHNLSRRTRWQNFLHKWFKMEFPTYTGQSTDRRITLLSHLIGSTSRRGRANFCVVNTQILAHLESSPAFVYPEFSNVEVGGDIRYIGKINEVVIFLNPWQKFDDTSIIIGKGTRNSEPGVYFTEYSREIVKVAGNLDMHNPTTKIGMFSRHAIVSTLKASVNYWKEVIIPEKKPLWRKLIKA